MFKQSLRDVADHELHKLQCHWRFLQKMYPLLLNKLQSKNEEVVLDRTTFFQNVVRAISRQRNTWRNPKKQKKISENF